MDINKAKALAMRLMKKHGLSHWSLKFDKAKRRAGACRYSTKTIHLSEPLTRIRSDDNVRNTILHEIAHALVGPGHGHDSVWRRKALAIGCDGRRCYTDAKVEGKWIGTCTHGKVFMKHRKPMDGATYVCRCNPIVQSVIKFRLNESYLQAG